MEENIPQGKVKLRSKQAAKHCKTSNSKMAKMRMAGDGPPYIKFGKVVLYDLDDLEEWLRKHRRLSTSE